MRTEETDYTQNQEVEKENDRRREEEDDDYTENQIKESEDQRRRKEDEMKNQKNEDKEYDYDYSEKNQNNEETRSIFLFDLAAKIFCFSSRRSSLN